jgi:hypothetical protein
MLFSWVSSICLVDRTSFAFDMSRWNNSVQAGWYTARTGGKSYGSSTRSRICKKKKKKTLYIMRRPMRGAVNIKAGMNSGNM